MYKKRQRPKRCQLPQHRKSGKNEKLIMPYRPTLHLIYLPGLAIGFGHATSLQLQKLD